MSHEDFLGPWGLLIIIVIGVGIILIALFLFICFLTPGCIGYECFKKRRDKSVPLRTKHQEIGNLKLNDISYRSWRLGSLYENDNNGTIIENRESHRDSFNSTNVQCENMERSSTLNLIYSDKQKMMKEFPTELTMSLQYLPPYNDIITGKLVIGIEALYGLPPKQYNGTLEPYVTLNIVKQSWSHRNKQKLHSFRTRGIRHTANPIYKETFIIANTKPQEAKVKSSSHIQYHYIILYNYIFHYIFHYITLYNYIIILYIIIYIFINITIQTTTRNITFPRQVVVLVAKVFNMK